jgi:anti-anti-sigma factor
MLNVNVKKESDSTRLVFSGRVDNEGSVIFQQALDKFIESGDMKAVLDFKKLEFINSSGIGKLLIFHKKMSNSGRTSSIEGISEEIFTLFKAIRLDKIIEIKG